jgi:hypothetical protein
MVTMSIKTICFLAFGLGLILTAVLMAQTEKNYCPVELEEQSIIAPQPQEEPGIPTKDKVYTVPRKQVLIESFTRTS